jgi:CRP-like cAMP-binding protein
MAALLFSTPNGELVRHLRQHRYFHMLSAARLEALAGEAACYRFVAGEVILLDGEPCAGLWIIHCGQIKVFKTSPDGHEHILHLLGPDDSLNDVAGLDGGPNPASAAALSEVTACCLAHETLVRAAQEDPALALSLIQSLATRTRFLVEQVEGLALYSVTTRVARFLIRQMDNPALTAPAINRTTIAAHLAIKPETLSRALASLERTGAIAVGRSTITVLRVDLLRLAAMQ